MLPYYKKLFPNYSSDLEKTDPELVEIFKYFAFDIVVNNDDLDDKTRFLGILSTLMGCQGLEEYKIMLTAALNIILTPIEIKEVVYQGVDYLRMGRVFSFLTATNEVFEKAGLKLPLEGQSTTNPETRLEKGAKAQADIFGDQII